MNSGKLGDLADVIISASFGVNIGSGVSVVRRGQKWPFAILSEYRP